jgi:peptidyl-prolyl cis-trans isomerase NIMA-interacting 1
MSMVWPFGSNSARPSLLLGAAFALSACTSLATGPGWTDGGLATLGPQRAAEREAVERREQERLARLPTRIGARHILVMHQRSQQKSEAITRTREEARKKAQECLMSLRSGNAWEAVLRECSDEPGALDRGGDLGVFERGMMVKNFSDAAFELSVGQISELVETPYGFHIIQRTE